MEPSPLSLKRKKKETQSTESCDGSLVNELVSFSLQEETDYVITAFNYKRGWEQNEKNTLIPCSFYTEESAIGLNCRKEVSEEALGKTL